LLCLLVPMILYSPFRIPSSAFPLDTVIPNSMLFPDDCRHPV